MLARRRHPCTFLLYVIILVACAACQSTRPTETPPVQTSAWGPVITLAEAPQTRAPVIFPTSDRIAAAWVGTDETGVYQYMRTIFAADALTSSERLPLPPVHPHSQTLAQAAGNHLHLMWLDAAYDQPDAGTWLWTAIITPDLLLERGPSRAAEPPVFHYTSLSNGDHSLWLVWSGGLRSEPTLYARMIDAIGRFRLPNELTTGGDFPALVQTNDHHSILFWLSTTDRHVYQGDFQGGSLANIRPITESVQLYSGDYLAIFRAGLDSTHVYLFWVIERGSGEVETWYATAPLDTGVWNPPVRLGITLMGSGQTETTFNGGAALMAASGENWLRWSAPISGQFDRLALAAQIGSGLGIVYLQSGSIVGYQNVVSLEQIGLLDAPTLQTDVNRHLYLSWSQPMPDGEARLNLTMTR